MDHAALLRERYRDLADRDQLVAARALVCESMFALLDAKSSLHQCANVVLLHEVDDALRSGQFWLGMLDVEIAEQ